MTEAEIEGVRERMYDDVIQIAKRWKAEGIPIGVIVGRMLSMTLILAEAMQCTPDEIVHHVKVYFGQIEHERPKAKA